MSGVEWRAQDDWKSRDKTPLSGCVFGVPFSLLRRKGVYGEKSLSGLRTNLLPEDLREKVRRSIFISSWKETSSNRCVHLGCGLRRAVCMGKGYLSIASLWTPGFHLPEVSPASRMTPRGQAGQWPQTPGLHQARVWSAAAGTTLSFLNLALAYSFLAALFVLINFKEKKRKASWKKLQKR